MKKIARSIKAAESQARSIESNSRSRNVNSVEREYFDLPKRGRGRFYRCGLEGHFVNLCKTKEEDTNRPKKGHIHQVT